MTVIIGVDEAGYGPNLGPLVVAATAWRLSGTPAIDACPGTPSEESVHSVDLYELLSDAVASTPDRGDARLAIADSKELYRRGEGLALLEQGVLAALQTARNERWTTSKANWTSLLAATDADPLERRDELPWYQDFDCRIPIEAKWSDVDERSQRLRTACRTGGVELLAISARLVFPAEFNGLVDHFGTKGAALSHVTLALVRRVVDAAMDGDDGGNANAETCCIHLDKHGGRNRYVALLQHHFSDSWIETVVEGRSESR
ncbi:MAG: hypothetical protein AAF961_17590, partial [Planctomycetota bacterium]